MREASEGQQGRAARRVRGALVALVLCAAPLLAAAAPSTFEPVIGNALLCRSDLDNAYFHAWLTTAFGPSYKHEGGAYWFRAEGSLWGAPVSEIMVSDDTSDTVFIGAVADTTPDKLDESIRAASGLRHRAAGSSPYPERVAGTGSKIVYFNTKAKIYCARFKPVPTGR